MVELELCAEGLVAGASFVYRPTLAFRVGVTGTREIAPANEPAVRRQVAGVLALVKARIAALAADPAVGDYYAAGAPRLRIISPLAEGADRLVAEEALALGFGLTVPLPFSQVEYEADFPAGTAEFRALLARAGADVIELDGARGQQDRSYEAAGRLVVRHSDLVIAVWDGLAARGRGGTADIVRFAARHGQPVWWVKPDGGGPVWIEGLRELDTGAGRAGEAGVEAALSDYLDAYIRPPLVTHRRPGGVIGQLPRRAEAEGDHLIGQLLQETERPDRLIWNSYRWLIRLMAGRMPSSAPASRPAPPEDECWTYWDDFYRPTDALAVGYGNRYRSSYVLVFALAAAAVACAVAGLTMHTGVLAPATSLLELVILLGIIGLVGVNLRRGWHARLIGFRLTAELFRKQQALALLGWSLPAAEPRPGVRKIDQLLAARESWVAWYFNAAQRAAPLPRGRLAGAALRVARAAARASLVAEQAAYHARRREQSLAAATRLGHLGEGLFGATVGLVAIKLAMMLLAHLDPGGHFGGWMALRLETYAGVAAAILPALSAFFVGIRGYAELELLADQSAQMEAWIETAAARIDGLDLDQPLASQDLGAELLDLAQRMLLDIQGWAQLFRLKAVEPG